MKLHGTIESEQASKTQSGNKYLEIMLTLGEKEGINAGKLKAEISVSKIRADLVMIKYDAPNGESLSYNLYIPTKPKAEPLPTQ